MPFDDKALPPAQRLAVLRAEQEARLSALEGGEEFEKHHQNLRWLALEIWRLEHEPVDSTQHPEDQHR